MTPSSELVRLLDLESDVLTATRVTGTVAAAERRHQPWGLVHGGLYTAAVESFATVGAFEAVKDRGQQAVDVGDFLRPHREGRLPVRRGEVFGRLKAPVEATLTGPRCRCRAGVVAAMPRGLAWR